MKTGRRNINHTRHADDTMAENNEDLKQLVMKVTAESSKAELQLNKKMTKVMETEKLHKILLKIFYSFAPLSIKTSEGD